MLQLAPGFYHFRGIIMEYIRAQNTGYRYESNPDSILENVSLFANNTSKIGLIGNNGCGKTTLFKLITGKLKPTEGSIIIKPGLRFGYLPQQIALDDDRRIIDYLWQSRPGFAEIESKLKSCKEDSVEYAELISEYYELGLDRFESEMMRITAGFDLDENQLHLPLSKLSGGEKTKVSIASLLLNDCDLMLLDEPTNHLEVRALVWLENYLKNSRTPFIIISHDRRFLDNCVDEIWELEDKTIRIFKGNYSGYKEQKETERKRMMQQYLNQQKKIKQLKKASLQSRQHSAHHQAQTGAHGNAPVYESIGNEAKKTMKIATRVEKRIQMMIEKEQAQKPFIEKMRRIAIESEYLKNKVILKTEKLSKSFDGYQVFDNISLEIKNSVKLAIIGPNGCGKTTLLNIISNRMQADDGSYKWAPKADVGFYLQQHEDLKTDSTILDEILQDRYDDQTMARIILGRLNIRRDDVNRRIANLSLGEKSKTALAKLLFNQFNVLILDEPTNHIELSAREALEEALENYQGTLIMVSHDRYLLERITTEVFDMECNRHFMGGYREFISG